MQDQQLKDFMAGLTETNKRIWDEWSKTLQSNKFGSGESVEKLYQQNLEAMEKLIQQALQAESKWLDQWNEGLQSTPNAPAPMLQIFGGVHSTMKAMLNHRAKMWEAMLKQARGMSFDKMPSVMLGADSQNTLTRIWEDFYQQAASAQQLMGQFVSKAQPAPKPQAAPMAQAAAKPQPAPTPQAAPKPQAAPMPQAAPAPKVAPKPQAVSKPQAVAKAPAAAPKAKAAPAATKKPAAAPKKKPTKSS